MNDVVIVAAKRTAIGSFLGSLSKIPATELGSYVVKDLLRETKLRADQICEIIMGQVLTAGAGQNPARQVALNAGLAKEISALTINQVCGSGLKAVLLGIQSIKNGDADIIIAGGQENMSLSPHLIPGSRRGFRLGNGLLVDSMQLDGLTDAYANYPMGITAENVAKKYQITRDKQDQFAANSQNKAEAAQLSGRFNDEIIPISIAQKNAESIIFAKDEFIKHSFTVEILSKLKPVFKEDGTVTAGNASGLNDGAAGVILMTEKRALELGLKPLASIRSYATIGLEPSLMGMGPVYATLKALKIANWSIDELDLIEANEAFAAQSIAVMQELKINNSKLNVNGGAIALGHPIGASGCRILVTLLHEMKKRNSIKGLATLCIGGGMGIALAVERKDY